MRFQEALDKMQEGELLARACWKGMMSVNWQVSRENHVGIRMNSKGNHKSITVIPLNWITATDWEVVE